MKKILSILLLSIPFSNSMFGQISVQASIKPISPTAPTVIITINPSATTTTRVSGVSLTIAIPVADAGATAPLMIIDNSANTSIAWVQQFGGAQMVNGISNYLYDFQGTGNVGSPSDDHTYTTGIDNEIVRVSFSGDPSKTAKIKLVSFSDFGLSGNSLFGLSFNGTDVADPVNPFYSIPSVSLAINNGAGTSTSETAALVPLPVKFISFSVVKNNNSAALGWLVENEDANTATYEIQKSINGVDFTKLAILPALNNGRSSNTYSFTQANLSAIRSSGVIYFRVKQTDLDGKFVYTDIKSVRLNSKGLVIGVYPNPIKSSFANVSFDLTETAHVILSVTDGAGKQVITSQVQGFKGANLTKLNMAKLANGSYVLKVEADSEVKLMPIVKAEQ